MGGQVAEHGQILDATGNVVANVTDIQKHQTDKLFIRLKFLPLAFEPRIHLGYQYQPSSSCHEEPHTHSLAPCGSSQYPLATMRHKQDLWTSKSNSFALTLRTSSSNSWRVARHWTNKSMRKSGSNCSKTVETDIDTAKEMGAMAPLVRNTVKKSRCDHWWLLSGTLWWYPRWQHFWDWSLQDCQRRRYRIRNSPYLGSDW